MVSGVSGFAVNVIDDQLLDWAVENLHILG